MYRFRLDRMNRIGYLSPRNLYFRQLQELMMLLFQRLQF